LVLIAAGTLKLYELAFEGLDESTLTLFLMVFSEAELLGGIWMIGGFDPVRTRWWAAAAFAGLTVSSLFQALAGKCSCGCFGSLSINPWLVLVFDLAAVAALLTSRAPADLERALPTHPFRFVGLGFIALVIGVVGWRQADLVTLAGTATAHGRPLHEATLTLIGHSGRIDVRTDQYGNFRLPLVRPGLYAVSALRLVSAPVPKKAELAVRGPGKKTTQQSRLQPSPSRPGGGEPPILWIGIPNCSEYDRLIKF